MKYKRVKQQLSKDFGWVSSLAIFQAVKAALMLLRNKRVWKFIFTTVAPLLVLSIAFNFCLVVGSFIFWKEPMGWYVPFMYPKSYNREVAERFLLFMGIIIAISIETKPDL